MQEYELSRITVRRALAQLRNEGLIIVVKSRGTFVAGEAERTTVSLGKGDQVVTRMPDPDERRKHGLHEGEPIVFITRADGSTETYGAHRVTVAGK